LWWAVVVGLPLLPVRVLQRCLELTERWHGRQNVSALYEFMIGALLKR
jgi:hypothetical protein